MGRVFTWDEVVQKRVPSRDSFGQIAGRIRSVLGSCPGVLAGTLCGSVLRDDCTERSDIDCLVIYDPRCLRDVMTRLQALSQEAAGLFVSVEFIPLAADAAATPLHHLEALFVQHLERASTTGVFRADPLPLVNVSWLNLRDDYRAYLTWKMGQLEGGLARLHSLSEEHRCRLYQKALEAPVHIARKVVALQGIVPRDESKSAVRKCYLSLADPDELELFELVRAADEEYSGELAYALRHPREESYRRSFDWLEETVWLSLDFVRSMLLHEAGVARP